MQAEDDVQRREVLKAGIAYQLEQDWDAMQASPVLKEVSRAFLSPGGLLVTLRMRYAVPISHSMHRVSAHVQSAEFAQTPQSTAGLHRQYAQWQQCPAVLGTANLVRTVAYDACMTHII